MAKTAQTTRSPTAPACGYGSKRQPPREEAPFTLPAPVRMEEDEPCEPLQQGSPHPGLHLFRATARAAGGHHPKAPVRLLRPLFGDRPQGGRDLGEAPRRLGSQLRIGCLVNQIREDRVAVQEDFPGGAPQPRDREALQEQAQHPPRRLAPRPGRRLMAAVFQVLRERHWASSPSGSSGRWREKNSLPSGTTGSLASGQERHDGTSDSSFLGSGVYKGCPSASCGRGPRSPPEPRRTCTPSCLCRAGGPMAKPRMDCDLREECLPFAFRAAPHVQGAGMTTGASTTWLARRTRAVRALRNWAASSERAVDGQRAIVK